MRRFKKFAYSTIVVLICAYISGYFSSVGVNGWYPLSTKPSFTPPNHYFPIIWTVFYLALIFSFYMVLKNSFHKEAIEANSFFLTQLLLHIIWTFTFFYKGYLALAFLVILYLDYIVFRMLRIFKIICPISAYVLYPYFIWLIFASVLNLSFIFGNGMVVFQ